MAFIEINGNNGISIEVEAWNKRTWCELKIDTKKDQIIIEGKQENIIEQLENALEHIRGEFNVSKGNVKY